MPAWLPTGSSYGDCGRDLAAAKPRRSPGAEEMPSKREPFVLVVYPSSLMRSYSQAQLRPEVSCCGQPDEPDASDPGGRQPQYVVPLTAEEGPPASCNCK